jgi:hypothetical protein
MTDRDLKKAKDDALVPWLVRALSLVTDRLADARIHAASGNGGIAHARLDELDRRLLDPGVGLLSRARTAFYRDAFSLHRLYGLDPASHDLSMGPTPEGERAARTAPIAGVDQVAQLRHLIEGAREGLQLVAATDRPSDGAAIRGARWGNWERSNADEIKAGIRAALSNAQIALFEAVGHLLVKPELR